MVENGIARARAFDLAAVTKLWLDLFEEVAEGHDAWLVARGAWPRRYLRHLRNMSAQKARAREFRALERREKRG